MIHLPAQLVRLAVRVLAVVSLVAVVWVIVGAIWFPFWWYRVFWEAKVISPAYLKDGWVYLLDYETLLLIVICASGIGLSVVIHLFRNRLRTLLDRWAPLTIAVAVFLTCGVALVLRMTQWERAWMLRVSEDIEAKGEHAESLIENMWQPPTSITAPAVFQYLDEVRTQALYSEIEAEFPEKQRTISSERSGLVSLGVGDSKAEGSGKTTETSSYKRQNSSTERKCIELLDFLLKNHRITVPTTVRRWYGAKTKTHNCELGNGNS